MRRDIEAAPREIETEGLGEAPSEGLWVANGNAPPQDRLVRLAR
jgi:hypothetical protein